MTEELSRTSALADRHRAHGSGLEDWNGMGTAWSYNSDPNEEHAAVREAVGMFDMSPLKKVFLRGADAASVLDHTVTRDVSRIAPGQSIYTSVLTDAGGIADDAIVSNNGGDEWMVAHGSGDCMALLEASAAEKDVSIEFTDNLHDLSVQGPGSLAVIDANCSIDLAPMKYFHHAPAALFGHACRLSRTGYSGERGYEIFASATVIVDIWDNLVGTGVMPCSFTALDKVRIEAGLLFYGYDMSTDQTPWEVGLGFTVSRTKGDFRGKAAVMAAEGNEKVRNVGLVINHEDMVNGEEVLSLDERDVGVVNSPCYSHRMGKSLALAHIDPAIVDGTVLDLVGDDITTTATVVSLPIYDPQKTKTHAG